MRGPHFLPYLLLLPLGACLPVLDRSRSDDAMDVIGASESWGNAMDGIGHGESWGLLPKGRSPPFVGGFPLCPRALHHALLALGEELQALRRQCVGTRQRREDFTSKEDFQSSIDRKPPMDPLDHILRDKYPKRKEANIKAHYGQ